MHTKSLPLADTLHILVLRSVVHCASSIVSDVVAVKVGHNSDKLAQRRAKVHDGDVHKNEASTVAQTRIERIADYDQDRSAHGQKAGESDDDCKRDTFFPP